MDYCCFGQRLHSQDQTVGGGEACAHVAISQRQFVALLDHLVKIKKFYSWIFMTSSIY